MKKEGSNSLYISQDGKVNLVLLFSTIVIFLFSLLIAEAAWDNYLVIRAPTDLSYNGTNTVSRNINFTFNITWQGVAQNISNCSLWVNNTGVTGGWQTVKNASNFSSDRPDDRVFNYTGAAGTISYMNYTFSADGNYTYSIACYEYNISSGAGLNFTANRTFFLDTVAPQIILDTPKGGVLADATSYNITSYETATFYVNVTDNSTQFVWLVLNTNATVTPLAPNPGLNESTNRSMTAGAVISAPDNRQYYFNLSGLLNFNSTFTSPGPHGVSFCANDTLGRITCTNKSDYIIMGVNITQMENIFSTMQQIDSSGNPVGNAFGGINITLGNGTEIPDSTFMNPITGVTVGGLTHKNFTFIVNITNNLFVHIVGASIDVDQFANTSRSKMNNTPSTEIKQQLGTGFSATMAWADIAKFIPSEVSYQFGILQLAGVGYSKKMYCNGTTVDSPNCHRINECNATVFGIYNATPGQTTSSTGVIPTGDACWLETIVSTSPIINDQNFTATYGAVYTLIFVDHFSGAVGGEDRGPPNVTFVAPSATEANHRLNRSTTVTQLINFTVDDTDSTGLNLTANNSINVTITLGGSQVALFSFFNSTTTNLSCYSPTDGLSLQNTTKINCNVTFAFNSNGTYLVNVTGRDTGNNNNAMNTTTNFFRLTVDQIPPVLGYFNITNSSTFNVSGGDGLSTNNVTKTYDQSSAGSIVQGGTLFVTANWTDNLTRPLEASFQFFNGSAGTWKTLNTTQDTVDTNITPSTLSTSGFSNLSFTIPVGHNNFEGANISFIIVANDSVGNQFVTYSRNITIQINDTTVPTVTINGTISVNNTNTSNTRPIVSWAVKENSKFTRINISVDGTVAAGLGVEANCQKYAFYDITAGTSNVEKHRNDSFQILDDPACTLANGTHFIRVIAVDIWGNSETVFHNFTVQSGSTPELILATLQNGLSAINGSNVTSSTGINFTATVGATGTLKNMSFTSSCNSSVTTFTNTSFITPFVACAGSTANRTVTVTVFDAAGNSITNTTQFLVDDSGPTLSVNAPTNGFSGANNITINLSAKDGAQQISMFGYYLDDGITTGTVVNLNSSASIGAVSTNATNVFSVNFTPGTHTIKFTALDTAGGIANGVLNNSVNSSVITFTKIGPIAAANEISNSSSDYLGKINYVPINTTVRLKDSTGSYTDLKSNVTDSNGTFELFLHTNWTSTNDQINITLTEINGSGANWDKINFSVLINNSGDKANIQNNWTNTVLYYVSFNNSIDEFLSNSNDYYGIVLLPMNVSGGLEIWWLENESNLQSRTNISACTAAFTATTPTPCFNFTSGGKTLVQVPHFSDVIAVNDSGAPVITVNVPSGNQTVSMFLPNITVTSDTVSCKYQINKTSPTLSDNQSMSIVTIGTDKLCTSQTERFKNLNAVVEYNITFFATDSNGNERTGVFKFNMSDNTAPNNGAITSSPSTTTATVTITGTNESVNATVNYGTTNSSLSSSATETDFNVTQTVSLSSLTASTIYYFNVTVCDFNGNCKTNLTVFSFTTSAAAAAAAAASSSSSGASGGGGAAVASTEAASTSKKWDSLTAGSSAVLTINNANIAVTGVVVDVKNAVTSAEVKVASLTTNPIATAAAGKVYQYLQLTKTNIADTDASKITVNFKVAKSWLSSNNVAEGDVVLYRYSDSKWNGLSTAMSGSDANNVLYSATTPGFSTFAIGSREAAPAAAEKPTEAAPAAETPTTAGEAPAAPGEQAKGEAAMEKKGLSTTTIAWIVVAVIVVAAGIGYFMWQKKKAE